MPSTRAPKPLHYMQYYVNRATIDPFRFDDDPRSNLVNSLLATALCRCFHLIIFFTLWAVGVIMFNAFEHAGEQQPLSNAQIVLGITQTPIGGRLAFSSTTLTMFGTILGFVIAHRTASSFERYNEGRKYWSAIVFGSRLLARTIWFHIPNELPLAPPSDQKSPKGCADYRMRTIIEKKSAINLIEAFAVSVKHYLRGEESIYYTDLYHLVKHLPSYALLVSDLSDDDSCSSPDVDELQNGRQFQVHPSKELPSQACRTEHTSIQMSAWSRDAWRVSFPKSLVTPKTKANNDEKPSSRSASGSSPSLSKRQSGEVAESILEPELTPSWNPPRYSIFNIFPFSLLVRDMKRLECIGWGQSAGLRGRQRSSHHSIPLELTFYLSSYISSLRERKVCDVPTHTCSRA
ncbi:hypothetical protein FRB94_007277 [Tulasnella sp. JGI-2019a]|nr:hypothetical protein FRB94_007277 [Tulasnella sp. JGI-2019a]